MELTLHEPNQFIRRLPKDIASRILAYIIDCIGISSDLSEDIKHFARCKPILQIRGILFNSDRVLGRTLWFMNDRNLFSKYNRKMILRSGKMVMKIENGMHFWEREQKMKLTDFEIYANQSLLFYGHTFDSRPNNYSYLVNKNQSEQDAANLTNYIYCYRVLHNLLCMMEPEDRAQLMTFIDNYYSRAMPYEENDDYENNDYYEDDDYDDD